MRVLWLINAALPAIAKELHQNAPVNEGWLTGLADSLIKNKEIELIVCFPQKFENKLLEGNVDGIEYVGYYQAKSPTVYDENLSDTFQQVLKCYKPDVVHIMGTEFPHSYSMTEACDQLCLGNRVVISIQGLVSVYAEHYFAGLPTDVCYGRTLRDLIKGTSLKLEKEQYVYRGEYEKKALLRAGYVMGRTDWDRCCTALINPSAIYLHGGEILRRCFYGKQWAYEKCEKHSVFISQATYPIKGFHMVLEAMAIVKNYYPDCKLYVASQVPYNRAMNQPKWRNSMYVSYICKLIDKYKLEKNIHYCGVLPGEEMVKQYLKANVFVSASAIENSPNSVGEAMMLGVPVVTSDVGGVKNMLVHEKEGYLYPFDEPYMLAYYIMNVFENKEHIGEICANAKKHAEQNHNADTVCFGLLSNYKTIIENNGTDSTN